MGLINTITEVPEDQQFRIWTIDDWDSVPEDMRGRKILLLSPEEFETAPTGSVFLSVLGNPVIKGVSDPDDDTRSGHLAYGPLIEES